MELYCCTCGGEMNLVTDTCVPLSPAYCEKQNLCDGCYASLRADSNYLLNEYTGELLYEFSCNDCDRCGSTKAGERYLYGSNVHYKATGNLVGQYFGPCCIDCFDDINGWSLCKFNG